MSKSVLKPKINPEYQSLVHPLSKEDYSQLKDSINNNGQFLDIIVNESGVILDGHTRYKILNELGIQPRISIKKFSNNLLERSFVIQSNLARRHLKNFQRIELSLKLKLILQKIASSNQKAGKSIIPSTELSGTSRLVFGKQGVNGEIGKHAKAGHDQVRQVEYILKKANSVDIQKLNNGQKSIFEVYKTITNNEKRRELMKLKPTIDLPSNCKLYCADFMEVNIPSNSIDIIVTNPPFNDLKKSIKLYKDLGVFAMRVLKNGGSLLTFCGTYDLPKFLNALLESGLRYWWLLCVKHRGQHCQMFQRKVFVEFRPWLWLVKGEKLMDGLQSVHDFIESTPNHKELHKWQQSPEDAEEIISKLTLGKNSIVLDPCMGSGSFGVTALKLGKKFIGIEHDRQTFLIARKRLVSTVRQVIIS